MSKIFIRESCILSSIDWETGFPETIMANGWVGIRSLSRFGDAAWYEESSIIAAHGQLTFQESYRQHIPQYVSLDMIVACLV